MLDQGEQIGLIVAYWRLFSLSSFLSTEGCSKQIWLLKKLFINFAKNGLGHILGDFFSQANLVILGLTHLCVRTK
jgi:hypothetical protein